MRPKARVAMLLLLSLVLTACPAESEGGDGDTDPLPPPVPDTTTTTSALARLCVLVQGDMEDCFEYGDMFQFYGEAIKLVQEYLSETFTDPALMEPDGWLFVREGDTGEQRCFIEDANGNRTPTFFTDMSFEYCSIEATVYVGHPLLWDFYSTAGDAAAVVAIAHETGHHFQYMADIPSSVTTMEQYIMMENQADCIAGAFMQWLDDKDYLDDADDIIDVGRLIPKIASAENDPNRDHGTIQERVESVFDGFYGGLAACNTYFPGNPLILG